MKVKVCGMRNLQNINEIAALSPDFIGFIFYEKSPRFVVEMQCNETQSIASLPDGIKKIGVFVNESFEKILEIANKYALNGIQLHGSETPLQCCALQDEFTVIKAFSIAEAADFAQTVDYEGCCDYFLFDTKTPAHGGSGQRFDWSLLDNYSGETPFFLSGGIDLDDVEAIKQIKHPKFAGVDINSCFETAPALKNVEKVRKFKSQLMNS
ncbi:MAG: phosphoribosylanthranilate isomerase [Prevotellaceae bacterium]|nr:phosphoribosylanthranilate isomerase [Prevotellaceae bacterium]